MRTATEYLWFSTKKIGNTSLSLTRLSFRSQAGSWISVPGSRCAEFNGRRRKRVVVKVMGEELRASG